MRILAIETSCDETAIAFLNITGPIEKPNIEILGNTLLSQAELHSKYGGVYPSLAKREHQKNLPILLDETLRQANVDTKHPQVELIAVTIGPGLEPALWTGITFAKGLEEKWGVPILPVNHMHGHIYSILYRQKEELKFPALALLISGGHTEIVLINQIGEHELIGETKDDAVGEAFDKVARMLGLPYPGGPEISNLAEMARNEGMQDTINFPRPMIKSDNLNFSFSGLKTAVLYKIKNSQEITPKLKKEIALAFENAVAEVLTLKIKKAILNHKGRIRSLIIAGGVSSNKYIQRSFHNLARDFKELKLFIPNNELATDNAIMIGISAYITKNKNPEAKYTKINMEANGNLSINNL